MLHLKVDNTELEMTGSEQLAIEDTNPIFNERGSQSLPTTLPATNRNRRALGFPDNPMLAENPNDPPRRVKIACGAYQREGVLNIDVAGREDGISINVGFDNSTLYQAWIKRKLNSLENLPEVKVWGRVIDSVAG